MGGVEGEEASFLALYWKEFACGVPKISERQVNLTVRKLSFPRP